MEERYSLYWILRQGTRGGREDNVLLETQSYKV